MKGISTELQLQVMICTLGHDGIRRVANASHPSVEGVEYLVSWQTADDFPIPMELERQDFRIIKTNTKGLSVNRNIALASATAPILLISDDDADYTEEGLRTVINAFAEHTEADLLTFRFVSTSSSKYYPNEIYDLVRRRHFISSIEIAFRRDAVNRRLWFNESFGIGASFPAGEEDIFLQDCLDAGLKCLYIPETIVRHDTPTTSGRNLKLPTRPQTKGAVFLRLHPHDWLLRMMVHALREIKPWAKGLVPSPVSYYLNWLKGVRMARQMKVFPTPDYSSKYPCHG